MISKNISKTSKLMASQIKGCFLEADEDEGDKCDGENPSCQFLILR
jgi:hypothetical protein